MLLKDSIICLHILGVKIGLRLNISEQLTENKNLGVIRKNVRSTKQKAGRKRPRQGDIDQQPASTPSRNESHVPSKRSVQESPVPSECSMQASPVPSECSVQASAVPSECSVQGSPVPSECSVNASRTPITSTQIKSARIGKFKKPVLSPIPSECSMSTPIKILLMLIIP